MKSYTQNTQNEHLRITQEISCTLILVIKVVEAIKTLTLTIRIHLINERPNPQMAPYLPAMVLVIQKDKQNPSQLKINATESKRIILLKDDTLETNEQRPNSEDLSLIPGLGRSLGERHGNALQYSSLEFHVQRSLAGYSSSYLKE